MNLYTGQQHDGDLLPLHRTKVAVRDMAEHLCKTVPVVLSRTDYGRVLQSLQGSSASFTTAVVRQSRQRARTLFETASPSPEQCIKAVFAHRSFGRIKGNIVNDAAAMAMVDRALQSDMPQVRLFCTGFPMKVFNPLETDYRGDAVDLGDVSVLLRFAELAEVLTHFGKEIGKSFTVVVISDGRMNSGMFKTGSLVCESYVSKLNDMITELGIEAFVSVEEFYSTLAPHGDLRAEYDQVTERIKTECHDTFDALLDISDIGQSIKAALEREYEVYGTSSFSDLFHSSAGSVRYEEVEQLSSEFSVSFTAAYTLIVGSILWGQRIEATRSGDVIAQGLPGPARANFLTQANAVQAAITGKAWHSTVEYFAVMEANKTTKILEKLVPDGIRVTTRPKDGQIGVHTSDQNQPSLFSYHSVPVIVPCNKQKNVKIDFQLRLHALTDRYRPVQLNGTDTIGYLHPDVDPVTPIEQLPWMRGS